MFRELVRIKQRMPTEDCIELLKNETRGVLLENKSFFNDSFVDLAATLAANGSIT